MLIYNVTVGVDKDIEQDWLQWMKTIHIPDVMKTGKFVQNKIYRVLTHDDDASVSYAVQYYAENIGLIQEYLDQFAPQLREEVQQRYGNKQLAYRTLLEEC